MIFKLYEQCLEDVREKYQLSKMEIGIITFLHNNPGMDTIGEIAENRLLSKGNVSRGADSLIQKGLLERVPDQTDRRWVHLILRPEAMPLVQEIERAGEEFHQKMTEDFSEQEIVQFEQLNQRLVQNITKHLGRSS